VLKTLAAAGALGALGASTLGAGERDAGGTRQLAGLDEHTDTVHTVQTLIAGPPTNPERPADFFYEPTGLHVQPGDVVRFQFPTPDHNVVGMHPAYGMRRRVPLGVDAFSSPLLGFDPNSIPGDMVDPPAVPGEGGGEGGGGPAGNATATAGTTTEAMAGNATATAGTTTEAMAGNATATAGTTTEAMAGNATATAGTTTEAMAGNETEAMGEASPGEGPVPDTWLLAFDTPGVYDMICSPHEGFGMAMRVVVGEETDTAFETSDPGALPEPRLGPVGLSRVTLTDPALEPEAIVDAGTVRWSELEANSGGGDGGEDDGGEGDGGGAEDA
jgi:plastocyanin